VLCRGSRGTRQLKDFMGEAGDGVNRQRRSTGDEVSESYEAVDYGDREDAGRHQPASRTAGRGGRGRPGTSGRGSYGEMRQQQQQQQRDAVTDDAERPWRSGARGRGLTIDHGHPQQPGYSPQRDERRDGPRDVEPRSDTRRGPGKHSVGYMPRSDDREPTGARSGGQSQEDWNDEVDVSRTSGKPVEQHREQFRAVAVQPAESRTSELRQSYSEHRVSDNERFQRHEGRHGTTEPARRIHPTRTISNRSYHATDNIPHRDRSSQIGGIVDAMNAISVKTAADDEVQRNAAPKSTIIVSGMICADIVMVHFLVKNCTALLFIIMHDLGYHTWFLWSWKVMEF